MPDEHFQDIPRMTPAEIREAFATTSAESRITMHLMVAMIASHPRPNEFAKSVREQVAGLQIQSVMAEATKSPETQAIIMALQSFASIADQFADARRDG